MEYQASKVKLNAIHSAEMLLRNLRWLLMLMVHHHVHVSFKQDYQIVSLVALSALMTIKHQKGELKLKEKISEEMCTKQTI